MPVARHRCFHDAVGFETGIDPKIIQEMAGHAQLSTTLDIYTHLRKNKLDAAAKKLNGIDFTTGKKKLNLAASKPDLLCTYCVLFNVLGRFLFTLINTKKPHQIAVFGYLMRFFFWRRRRDSNPRGPCEALRP